jgi:cytochrome c-type biogenesis protein
MPIAAALLAGALATLNPCGFVLLLAFLSWTIGARDASPPPAPTRLLRGVIAGLLVTLGCLGVFAVVGIPLSLGATQLATAMPWVGLLLGLAMAVAAVATLANRRLPLPVRRSAPARDGQGARAMLLFGAGYGLASVSCTLPVFLIVVGASVSSGSVPATLVAFGAYAVGMALVIMALSIGAALLRDGLARTLKGALPHLRWVNGGLLLLVSAYLVDYWGSVVFASADSRPGDPLVGLVQRSTTLAQTWITTLGSRWLLAGAAAIVTLAALVALWQWTLRPEDASDGDRGAAEQAPSRTDASTMVGE